MEKEKAFSEIKCLVNQYNRLINEKSKPKYGLKPISFSAETGMITGEFHQITNYSIWELFSAQSLNQKLNTIWYDLNGLVSAYATNFCGISKDDMARINLEKEILGVIEQYNTLVNQAKEKGKTKEGYLPISFDFSNGMFANPWHEPYSTIFFGGIESGTKDLWHTLIDMCSKYMTNIYHLSEFELLQRQIKWYLGSWNTWCDHEKQSFHIELNEDLHKLEGYEIELPFFANFDSAQSIVSLNHKLSDLVDVLSLAGYSVEDMASAPLTDNMKKVCHNRETLRKKIAEIEDCVAKYNKEAKECKVTRLSFDKNYCQLDPSQDELIAAWDQFRAEYNKDDNFAFRKASQMAQNSRDKNVSLLQSIFYKVNAYHSLSEDTERLERKIKR